MQSGNSVRTFCPGRQLSVVVGSVESESSISRCLDALVRSCAGIDAEILVVDAGGGTVIEHAVRSHPGIVFFPMPADTLTPRLWSEGLAASSGHIVAFTTGHCFVTEEWAASLLRAAGGDAAAAGGPIRLATDASTLDAAIFFLRYSAYMNAGVTREVCDIAGDNAAYVKGRIPGGSWSREHGFWEHDVNRAIRTCGGTLHWANGAVAEFGSSFDFRSICRHRFAHGRLFGVARAGRGESPARIVLASPLVPFVIAARAGWRAMRFPLYRTRFLAALPLMLLVAFCWALGEARGALDSTVADRS